MRELEYWDDARFVTLTYSEENLPVGGTLVPRDLQLFHKRLRKDLDGRLIKFYAVGEYGEQYGRPHYHGIYFGLCRKDAPLIEGAWNRGRIDVGTVTAQSINYVTGYITKKLWGEGARKAYEGREPPFLRCSKGLGERWLYDHSTEVLKHLGLRKEGKTIPMPRYYFKKLEADIPEELREYLMRVRAAERDSELELEGVGRLELAERAMMIREQVRRDLEAKREHSDARKGITLKRMSK